MYGLAVRRLLVLALAYALALAPVLPLLAARASAADLFPAGAGEICATKPSGVGWGPDVPNEHRSACPHGAACAIAGCGGGVLAAGAGAVTVVALRSAPLLIDPAAEAPPARASGAHLARAPPRA
jgi:hypothetical protein